MLKRKPKVLTPEQVEEIRTKDFFDMILPGTIRFLSDHYKAMYYLHLAAEHGNQYAAQLIHSIRVNGNWTAALASLRLLGHMARVIQNRLEDERRGRENSIDRKLRRKIEEKKQAHGLKQ